MLFLLLGLLLAAGSAAFVGLLIAYNFSGGPTYTVTMFGQTLGHLNTLGAFLSGLGLALVFALALAMASLGTRHGLHRRAELREARQFRREHEAEHRQVDAQTDVQHPTAAAQPDRTDQPQPAGASRGSGRRHGVHLFGH